MVPAPFSVKLTRRKKLLSLIGSKEGIGNMAVAFVDPGDEVLVSSPCYPVYHIGTAFSGGKNYFLPLKKENQFLPDLDAIPTDVADKAKLLWINYPNNPTAAVADASFYKRVIEFANKHNVIVCHDAAYTEMGYDGYRPMSFFEVEGAREVGIEFHSLSKTFNMTGWRIGMAVGNPELVGGLAQAKSNLDSGIFQAVQEAGIEALRLGDAIVEPSRRLPGSATFGDGWTPRAAFLLKRRGRPPSWVGYMLQRTLSADLPPSCSTSGS